MGGKGRGLGQDGSNRQYRPSLSHLRRGLELYWCG